MGFAAKRHEYPDHDRTNLGWCIGNGRNLLTPRHTMNANMVLSQPPITFQPPPPPTANPATGASSTTASRQPEKPSQPDLITRYNLKHRLGEDAASSAESVDKKGKGWSSNRDERQTSLQRRREEMILAARRKMEAKDATEKNRET